jgi:tripartite-type tricarboxylate transporter receptor subunit TctC
LSIVHIPYKGTGQSIPALVAGDVTMAYSAMPSIATHVKTGRLKVLAVSTAQRSPTAPDVPTVAELGVAGYDFAEHRARGAGGDAAGHRGADVSGDRQGAQVVRRRGAVRTT